MTSFLYHAKLHFTFDKGCKHGTLGRWSRGSVSLDFFVRRSLSSFVMIFKLVSNSFIFLYVIRQQLFNRRTM